MRSAHAMALVPPLVVVLLGLACGKPNRAPTTGDIDVDSDSGADADLPTSPFGGVDSGGIATMGASCAAAVTGKSSVGCDYYVLPPPLEVGTNTACLAAFLANGGTEPVQIGVVYKGYPLDPSTFAYLPSGSGATTTYAPLTNATIPPKQVAIVMLSNELPTACPGGMKSATGPVSLQGTGVANAFHITTSAPVVAYDLYPYGGGSSEVTSATLLLPTSVWDANYVATTAYVNPGIDGAWLGFLATAPTDVTVLAPVAITGGVGVASSPAQTPVTYHVDTGQYLKLSQPADLAGTIVKASAPIGVWGGNLCADVPSDAGYCDGMHQQLPPVRALGSKYVGVRYRNRIDGQEEVVPWRIVGAVDGTTLTFDPPVTGAPTSVGTAQVADFSSAGPFVVSSQDADHPFYLAAYMTGCTALQGSSIGCPGDPEFVNVVPATQYLSDYTFFTDPTYPDTNLVFVRAKDVAGVYHDVSLDCAGTLTGWADVNASFQYTRVDLVKGNFAKQGTCDNGRHQATSTGNFGLTVWGWGSSESVGFPSEYVSYAYPAGASIAAVNTVVVPPVVK